MSTPPPSSTSGADVRVIPPLVYAAPFLLTAMLDHAVPLRLPDVAGRHPGGLALVVAGVALAAAGAGTFRVRHTTVIPHHEVSTMVTTGPYARTRNPMYMGMTIAYMGGSLLVGSWWPLLVLPVIVGTVDRVVIQREEAYLRHRFGEAYETYCRRARRWV